jgi:hypothetical protein
MDLMTRGVAVVDVLVVGGREVMASCLLQTYPSAVVVGSSDGLLTASLACVAARDWDGVKRGLSAVWRAPSHEAAHAVLEALTAGGWRRHPEVVRPCRIALDQSQSLWRLSQRARLAVLRTEDLVGRLQAGCSAALQRHGPFQSPEAAAAFAEAWLRAAERRHAGSVAAWPRRPRGAGAAAPPAALAL